MVALGNSDIFVLLATIHVLINPIIGYNTFFDEVNCVFGECCTSKYVPHNLKKLEIELNQSLFGQPLVQNSVTSVLTAHLKLENPPKALVLSFHGATGSGKNYVAKFIANSLYRNGLNSKYVHMFIASRDFPHNNKVNQYKDFLIQIIEKTIKKCAYSLFIFDEIDKIPLSLMDVIKAYVDTNPDTKIVDPTKSIFIFLSNTGSKSINDLTLSLHNANVEREQFDLKMFRSIIEKSLYNIKSDDNKGLWHSTLIFNNLIDYYIPFLPLKREHVKKCVLIEFSKYNTINNFLYLEYIDEILDQLIYEPFDMKLYSNTGCKRVSQLVRNLMIIRKDLLLKSTEEEEQQNTNFKKVQFTDL